MDANSGYAGALTGGPARPLTPGDQVGFEAKMRAQQQHALNQHVAGAERQLRVQVLSLAVSANPNDAVEVAAQFWDFITAGDPTEAEDPNRL
jgi:hypothetical protein